MTAAATSREITPQPALRGAPANTTGSTSYDDVPVVMRLPNVDPDAKVHRAHGSSSPTAVEGDGSGAQNRSSRRGQTASGESQTDRRPVATTQSETSTTTKLLALAWRVGIVAAAIGLVVLAYRIINGPPASPEAGTPQINALATGDPSSEETNPTISPAPFSPAGPNPLSELSPGPTIVEPTVTVTPSPQPHDPIGGHERDSPATNPNGEGLVGPENTLPIGAAEGTGDTWSRSPTYDDQWRSDADHHPAVETNEQRPWAARESDRRDDSSTAWANAENQPHGDLGYDYPISDPRTWRTPADWYAPSATAQNGFEQPSPSWEEDSRSAARLRPEIEQPPLPR